jgi:hypothetical protein
MKILLLLLMFLLFAGDSFAQAAELNGNQFDRQLLITLNNPTTPGLSGAGSTWKGWNYGGGYRTSAPISYRVSALSKEFKLTLVDEWPIHLIDVHCIVVTVSHSADIESVVDNLNEHPYVDSVQLMQLFATQTVSYNDPLLELQKSVSDMQVLAVHQWTQGKGVTVGIIDTGINVRHPDLRGQIRHTEDFVLQAGDHFEDDEHGTAIAGIIAAVADNREGIVGVAPGTKIRSYKACWPQQADSSSALCSSFTLAQALSIAIDDSVDIINLSLAGPKDPLLERIVLAALNKGVIVVGAVAENASILSQFPASIAGVIAVREKSSTQNLADFSDWGIFLAPGSDILTTTAAGKYSYQSGSSLSAAHVSGVIALLKQMQPQLRSKDVRALLYGGDKSSLNEIKVGVYPSEVNACQSLNSLLQADVCEKRLALTLEDKIQSSDK